jgi:replicative DNA helicase
VSRVPHDRFRSGKFSAAIHAAIEQLANSPLHLNDASSLTILELKAEARRLQQRRKTMGVIVVDYLQLMTGKRTENRQIEIAEVARGLKHLARELNVQVVAIAQLSLGV